MRRPVNPFDLPGKWHKGNFHCHTRSSDGALWVQDAVAEFRKRGFSVLAITDHEQTNDIRGLSDDKILVLNGMEMHPVLERPTRDNYHICGVHLPHGYSISRASRQAVQPCLDQAARVGAVNILAHPKEMSHTLEEFIHLKNLHGVEVWTSLSEIDGHMGSSEDEWAEAMDAGVFLTAIGSDDTHWAPRHGWRDVAAGWTMLKMPSLTAANVLKAVKTGATYASGGPAISDFRYNTNDNTVTVKSSAATIIDFKGPKGLRKTRVAPAGKSIRSFTWELPEDWPWVRTVVTDDHQYQAWTNPIWPKRKKKA